MSRCFTLTRTGLVQGIVVSRTTDPTHPLGIYVGQDFDFDFDFDIDGIALIRHGIYVLLDKFRRPEICTKGNRLYEASVIRAGSCSYLRASYAGQRGVLVHIDTSHTEPCETGGRWQPLGGRPRVIGKAQEGHITYSVRVGDRFYDNNPFAPSSHVEVDNRGCYNLGLVLLMPGDRLEVIFHAPGSVVGVLTLDRFGELMFELTSNEVDENYKFKDRDYQEERDASDAFDRDTRLQYPDDEYY